MMPSSTRRRPAALVIGLLVVGLAPADLSAPRAEAGLRSPVDPTRVIPIEQVAPHQRESVAETIRDHTFHHQGAADTFPCNPRIYLNLLNEPAITLALWKDLSDSPVRLQPIGPNKYYGTDGSGASATWEFVYRSSQLHILMCQLEYVGPRGNLRLNGRIVLVVRSGYYKEVNGEPWVRHDVEAFVKIDSKGWKAAARTVRPVIEKVLEDQVREAGWFVSLMGRLVELYPNWATQVAATRAQVPPEAKAQFRDVVAQTRRPGASEGRPTLMAESAPPPSTRRR